MAIVMHSIIPILIYLNYVISFEHGTNLNEQIGGTCIEFKKLNKFNQCCPDRNDQCYMIHHDTRCYCDTFCSRSRDDSDCCPDAFDQNFTTCKDNDFYMDNCNKCTCKNGVYDCTKIECLINLDLLNEINNKNSSWIASNYSDFWGKTLEYGYLHKLGTILDNKRIKKFPKSFNYDYHDEPAFDFRSFMAEKKSGKNFLIRNMGDCGSSWAFSTLDVASDRAALHIKRLKTQNPSVQHLLSCSDEINKVKICKSNTVEKAWEFLEALMFQNNTAKLGGVVDEECYPFTSQNSTIDKCQITNLKKIKCQSNGYVSRLYKASSGSRLDKRKIKNIMKEIRDNGPVQMVFRVFSDFFMYKSGIYSRHTGAQSASEAITYHSVKVLGWNKTEDGIPYWIAANYWGPDWGENGYFRIRIDDKDTEIGTHVYGGLVTYGF